ELEPAGAAPRGPLVDHHGMPTQPAKLAAETSGGTRHERPPARIQGVAQRARAGQGPLEVRLGGGAPGLVRAAPGRQNGERENECNRRSSGHEKRKYRTKRDPEPTRRGLLASALL